MGESSLGVYACSANEAERLGVVGRQLAVSGIEGARHHVPEALKVVLGNGPCILDAGLLVPPPGCQLRQKQKTKRSEKQKVGRERSEETSSAGRGVRTKKR